MAPANDFRQWMEKSMRYIIKPGILFLFIFTAFFCSAGEEKSNSADILFRNALNGDISFDESLHQWAQILRESSVPSAELYYNMANALALNGRDVEALALYGRAIAISPGKEDFRYNRDLLLKQKELGIPDWTIGESILWFPVLIVGYYGMWFIALSVSLLAFLFMVIMLVRKTRPSMFVMLGSLLFIFYCGVILASWENRIGKIAVSRNETLRLFTGDSPLYPDTGELKDGEELLVLEERDGWVRVRSTAGRIEGWCEGTYLLNADEVVNSY